MLSCSPAQVSNPANTRESARASIENSLGEDTKADTFMHLSQHKGINCGALTQMCSVLRIPRSTTTAISWRGSKAGARMRRINDTTLVMSTVAQNCLP